ncbi:endoplasmic reticulum resident protein 44 [Scaptodrosophila lebanonensis]|uniref:Endoplasmic reticulum resident protein 44 n=1 Tax=Drosophila lebanonensis TaxID=7225 RepID=A0A6J2TI26_DROLE|nr:endoplasmic reticulum resident protein 44 [Scaptodrosophila lebanonensis]
MTVSSYNKLVKANQLVLILFYNNWCMWSRKMLPAFDKAADLIRNKFKPPGTALLAKVECDKNVKLCKTFKIKQYPTAILVNHSTKINKEYKNKRSEKAIVNFMKKHIKMSTQKRK